MSFNRTTLKKICKHDIEDKDHVHHDMCSNYMMYFKTFETTVLPFIETPNNILMRLRPESTVNILKKSEDL